MLKITKAKQSMKEIYQAVQDLKAIMLAAIR